MDKVIGRAVNWTSRDGTSHRFARYDRESGVDSEEFSAAARKAGWPGHSGGFWNYFKDDLRRFFGLPRPQEHPAEDD